MMVAFISGEAKAAFFEKDGQWLHISVDGEASICSHSFMRQILNGVSDLYFTDEENIDDVQRRLKSSYDFALIKELCLLSLDMSEDEYNKKEAISTILNFLEIKIDINAFISCIENVDYNEFSNVISISKTKKEILIALINLLIKSSSSFTFTNLADLDSSVRKEADNALMIFLAGDGHPKAVPFLLVKCVEDLELDKVETVNGHPVIQYRGSLIPLVHASDSVKSGTTGTQSMMIFSDEGRSMGLVVDKVVGIVETHLHLDLVSDAPAVLGAAIISGRATEILDVGYFFSLAFGDWFERKEGVGNLTKLLLVDDSLFYRNLIEPVLRGAGYDVISCASGHEALEWLQSGAHFDVIVADIEMPEMDGFHLAHLVRHGPFNGQMPIIALSSDRSPKNIERAKQAGFTDCIARFDRPGLIAALKELSAIRLSA